jgi:hypothetical protein
MPAGSAIRRTSWVGTSDNNMGRAHQSALARLQASKEEGSFIRVGANQAWAAPHWRARHQGIRPLTC